MSSPIAARRVGARRARCAGARRSAGARLTLCGIVAAALVGCAPYQAARHYASGTRALDRGDVSVATEELERAAALEPRASEVHNHLGLAYLAAGRRAAALRAFERAVALDCRNAAAQANLRALRRDPDTAGPADTFEVHTQ